MMNRPQHMRLLKTVQTVKVKDWMALNIIAEGFLNESVNGFRNTVIQMPFSH
jgi:hypothetical protein